MDGCKIYQLKLFLFSFPLLFSICTAQTIVFQLADGYYHYEGRVEVYFQGEWGTVFGDYFDWTDAHVVCRELGFGGVDEILSSSLFGSGTGPVLNFLNCSGYELDISECMVDSSWLQDPHLYHHLDAGLRCNLNADDYATEGSIRLAAGNLKSEGRVELLHSSSWGTVCDDNWDIEDAEVVCRQLGYPGALSAEYGGSFDPGTGGKLFDYVHCVGHEDRLTDCFHGDWYNTWCSHYDDAGVRCIEPEYLTPRLANGSSRNEGRVEVWTGYQWERVCQSWFNSFAEDIVCRQLGYDTVNHEDNEYSRFGNGNTMPVALQFLCNDQGDETESLSECDLHTIERYDCDGVSIKCYRYEDDEDSTPNSLKLYLIPGGVVGLICLVSGHRYWIMKTKKHTQTKPNDAPATQCITQTSNCRWPSIREVAQRTGPAPPTDESRPPHHLPPMDRPPSYSEANHSPPSYGVSHQMIGQHTSVSSYPKQHYLNMHESAQATMPSSKGDDVGNLTTPSGNILYEDPGSTQLPALPVLARPDNLPSVM